MKCSRCGKKITVNQAFFGEEGTPFAGQRLCQSCYYKTLMKRKLRYDKKRKNEYSKRNQYKKTNFYRTKLSEESKESEESSKTYGKREDEYKLMDEKPPTTNE